MTIVTTVILGVVYPLVVTGIAQVAVPRSGEWTVDRARRHGDRLAAHRSGVLVAWILPAAAVRNGDAVRRSQLRRAANSGPTNKKLIEAVTANVEAAKKENPNVPVPVDLVTTSASGFDPHITPAAADFQVPRVARERGMSEERFARSSWRTPKGGSSVSWVKHAVNVARAESRAGLAIDRCRSSEGGSESPLQSAKR